MNASTTGAQQQAGGPCRALVEPDLTPAARDRLSAIVAQEVKTLEQKCSMFQQKMPADAGMPLDTLATGTGLEGVVSLVKAMQANWEKERRKGALGKTSAMFHKFCGTLDSHSSLLSLLPEGSEYVSVFTGSLNVVIQASANHEKVAAGLAHALLTISEHIAECKLELEIFSTDLMVDKIADLYAHIFRLLANIMDWLTRKRASRMLCSFNDNLCNQFEAEIATIKEKAANVRNVAAQSARAEGRVTRLTLEEVDRNVRLGLEEGSRHHAEMRRYAAEIATQSREEREERRLNDQSMRQVVDCLSWMIEARSGGSLANAELLSKPHRLIDQRSSSSGGLPAPVSPATPWTSEEIRIHTRELEDMFDRDRVRLDVDITQPLAVPHDIPQRIEDWVADSQSPLLWIDGPSIEADGIQNELSLLASGFIEKVSQSDATVMSYFCDLPRRKNRWSGDDHTRETQGAMSLLAALICQMIEVLPSRLRNDVNLPLSRLKMFNRSKETWEDGVVLLQDLAALMPSRVFCVIDGLHLLEDRSSSGMLLEVLGVFRKSPIEVLLTTSGRAAFLSKELGRRETCVIEKLKKTGAVPLHFRVVNPSDMK